jgi:hypothetical protein
MSPPSLRRLLIARRSISSGLIARVLKSAWARARKSPQKGRLALAQAAADHR